MKKLLYATQQTWKLHADCNRAVITVIKNHHEWSLNLKNYLLVRLADAKYIMTVAYFKSNTGGSYHIYVPWQDTQHINTI